ncbi:hypothetical protein SF123566_8978 [Shigella flexneri 1235-66]|nr:hypothetical protein SF123566_8978 [Shigella flexneri 1235-66]
MMLEYTILIGVLPDTLILLIDPNAQVAGAPIHGNKIL